MKIMKKRLIFLCITVGLCIMLGVTSRLSAEFSEWYAVTLYPVWVGTSGRIFGILPFSAAELLIILLIAGALAGLAFVIIKIVKGKGRRGAILLKTAVTLSCVASSALLVFILNCGINYNSHTFLRGQITNAVAGARSRIDEWKVYLTMLDEFYTAFPDLESGIATDDNGVFRMRSDIRETAPAAMRNLSHRYPRLASYFPSPKPALFSELMSDGFILGFYSPFTIEANYNNIVCDVEKAYTALHELAHVGGFMREEEANLIAFLAGRESGVPDLIYAAYFYAFYEFGDGVLHTSLLQEELEELPAEYRDLYNRFTREGATGEGATGIEMLPGQMQLDQRARGDFWRNRYYNISYVYGDDGEVVDVIVNVNPVVDVISGAVADVNDGYLKSQGQSDGIESYYKMIDLVMVIYLEEMGGN